MGDYNDPMMRNQTGAGRGTTKTQNRANVLQLKLIGQSHPTGLTANLLKLFEPRPPLEFKPPPEKRKCPPYSGMGQFVSQFAERDDPDYAPPVPKSETPAEKKARIHNLRLEKGVEKAKEELEKYDPNSDPNIAGDPYKTLFVARLNYETSESKIKREFESYGPIKRVRLVTDKETNKPRGYAFIEYVHTRDMKAAYKQADGTKIDGRRVLVDVERGRTVPNWRPRRLGGGLGTTRVASEDASQREVQPSARSSRSEEPRAREDRHSERETEKSRERKDREREREKSRERSHDRARDRDHREDRHHRDRDRERGDREKDRERGRDRDRERDRDRRDHDRDRDRGRDSERDRDRERGRDRDRAREKERDYEIGERDRAHSRDKGYERGDSKHERDHYGERDYDHADPEDDHNWYEQPEQGNRRLGAEHDQRYDHYEQHRSAGQYDHKDVDGDRYDRYAHTDDRYDQMEEDDYHYGRGASESREREHDYHRSERSVSREYEE